MATLAALKKKIADLEAQVEKVTKAEMGGAIAKVRKIMADFGITLEHLADDQRRAKPAAKKAVGHGATARVKGSKPPKYRDPATGVTWAGVGRAPAWIADSKNRDDYLISKGVPAKSVEDTVAPAKKAVKRAASAKRVKPKTTAKTAAKAAARKRPVTVKRVSKAAAPASAAKKPAVKKVAGKAARKRAPLKAASTPAASGGAAGDASSS